jgi:hypothetical protein
MCCLGAPQDFTEFDKAMKIEDKLRIAYCGV